MDLNVLDKNNKKFIQLKEVVLSIIIIHWVAFRFDGLILIYMCFIFPLLSHLSLSIGQAGIWPADFPWNEGPSTPSPTSPQPGWDAGLVVKLHVPLALSFLASIHEYTCTVCKERGALPCLRRAQQNFSGQGLSQPLVHFTLCSSRKYPYPPQGR